MSRLEETIDNLEKKSKLLRQHIIKMVGEAGSGHPGGSLSAVEIVTALYFEVMNTRPKEPDWPDRDKFVLSKGHAAPVLYAALAEKGYFPLDELWKLRKTGAMLQGHPDMKKTLGVEISTGSLGQGLSAANGMAIAAKLDGRNSRVFVLLGDGELEEGQVWEAAMASAHYKLDNLVAFVDHNHLQIDGRVKEVMSPEPIKDKFYAFGWNVIQIDGHDFNQILHAIKNAEGEKGKPTVIVAETVKGKGVSFMEDEAGWHGKAPDSEQMKQALEELGGDSDDR